MRHAQAPPTYSFVILALILILLDTVLAYISVKVMPASASGVSLLYLAAAFMIIFTLWFGLYGAIAAYLGTLLGSGLLASEIWNQNPGIAMVWAIAGLLQVMIPFAAVRIFGADLEMKETRDWTIILLFGVLINNAVGAAWGAFTLSLVPGSAVNVASVFSTWLIGNIVVTILILPLMLRLFSARVKQSKLFVKQYWN